MVSDGLWTPSLPEDEEDRLPELEARSERRLDTHLDCLAAWSPNCDVLHASPADDNASDAIAASVRPLRHGSNPRSVAASPLGADADGGTFRGRSRIARNATRPRYLARS